MAKSPFMFSDLLVNEILYFILCALLFIIVILSFDRISSIFSYPQALVIFNVININTLHLNCNV